MKLTMEGLRAADDWRSAGIRLPEYDVCAARQRAQAAPRWVHFGIGNIFRTFIGGIADDLLSRGGLDRGLTCVETFDFEVVDRIYRPFDNLALQVTLEADGSRALRVLGSLAEAVDLRQRLRLKEIFRAPSLQLVSFTVTEKGYSLKTPQGDWLPDIETGPERAASAMGVLTAMLHERFAAGGTPVALVSMDNCAQNGKLLKEAVLTLARRWNLSPGFLCWLEDESKVAFCSTMIDKITPRPSEDIGRDLEKLGLEDMDCIITGKRTYIAPFVNAERPQYLVIEDRFPNGRPALEQGFGVYMGDFNTVCKAERMKVTALLNPAHTALGPLGVVLGQERFADMLLTLPVTLKMARQVVYDEGMPVAADPVILSPKDFADEVFRRFTNVHLGDTNLRLATDASQGLAVRFGETIKAHAAREGTAAGLTAIPLGIAGFLRYLVGTDDTGRPYELAPDPLAEQLHSALKHLSPDDPEAIHRVLKPWLSDETLFGTDLYKACLGEKIETMFRQMLPLGAALKTIEQYIH